MLAATGDKNVVQRCSSDEYVHINNPSVKDEFKTSSDYTVSFRPM